MGKKIGLYEVWHIDDLRDMMEQSVKKYGDKAAFLVKPKKGAPYDEVSYKKYYSHLRAFGTALISSYSLEGKKVAIVSENRYEWTIAYLAVIIGGGIVVPIDKELPSDEITGLINRAEAEICVCSAKYAQFISEIPNISIVNMDDGFWDFLKSGEEKLAMGDTAFDSVKSDVSKMCALLFTSGTTGIAKGVMLSQHSICNNLMNMRKQMDIRPSDVFSCLLPLHHTYQCTCGFLCPMYCGSSVAFCEGLKYIQKNMIESKTTMVLGVPAIFENMYKRIMKTAEKEKKLGKMKAAIKVNNALKHVKIDLSSKLFKSVNEAFGGHLRILVSGAAAIDPAVAKGFRDLGILFLQGYGLTECSPIVGVNRDVDFRDDSAGMLISNMELIIDEPNEDGIGEIVVKGENVMMGYYEDEEATNAVLKDGWFHTGDLGYMDKDKFIYITGRKKNLILTKNGKNVFPEEIESYLSKYPEIKECLVYGKDNETTGDTDICAEIFPDFDLFKGQDDHKIKAAIEEIVRDVNEPLPMFKKIRKVHIRKEEFEKTTTQKIKRYKL